MYRTNIGHHTLGQTHFKQGQGQEIEGQGQDIKQFGVDGRQRKMKKKLTTHMTKGIWTNRSFIGKAYGQ